MRNAIAGGWRSRRTVRATPQISNASAGDAEPHTSPLRGVPWSLILIGLLAYVGVIVTYKVAVGSTAITIALVGLLLQRERLRLPPFIVLFGLFVIWSAIGLFQSSYTEIVWERLSDCIKIFLIVLVATNALRTREHLRLFAIFFLGCFALFPVRGALFNYFISHYTLLGRAIWNFIYENPNDLAALTLLQFSMAAGLVATERRGWVRLSAQVGIIVLPLVTLLTQSRGAFLALSAMIAVMIVTRRGKRLRLIISIAVVGVIVGTMIPSSAWQRFRGLTNATSTSNLGEVDAEGSAKDRYAVWTVAFRIIAQSPYVGVGLGAYALAHRDHTRGSTDLSDGARGFRDTHSTYLNLAAEVGIPGLLLFLAMVAAALAHAERARRMCADDFPKICAQLLYLELGLFAFLVAGIFGSFAKLSFMYLHVALIWSVAEECLISSPHAAARLHRVPRMRSQGWRTPRAWRSA